MSILTLGARPVLLALAFPGLCPLVPGLSPAGEVYMTRQRALARAFPTATRFLEHRHVLSDRDRKRLEDALGRKLPERGYLCWLALDADGEVLGFSVLTAEVGRTEPFFLLVSLTPEGLVHHVDVLEYREPRGMEVRGRGWLARFDGISRKDAARRIPRVPVIPGATLSCHAVGRAVDKTLELHALYLDRAEGRSAALRLKAAFAAVTTRVVEPDPEPAPEPRPRPDPDDERRGRRAASRPAMGDVLRLELAAPADPRRCAAALAEAASLEDGLSAFRPDSLVGRANRLALGAAIDLRPWPWEAAALAEAFAAARRSGGCFSPVAGVADPATSFRLEEGLLRRRGPGRLDAGGFGKGLAADALVDACERLGLRWRAAGFRSSFRARGPDGVDLAVAVSGTSLRGCHIVDPRTGRRPDGEAVLVTAATAFEAEVLAKATFLARAAEAGEA
ncbi:MAG: FAD:protein FMN transferase [Planctomycetota bacterium]